MTRRLIAFPWYGGKYSHLNWLLPLLPTCHHYVEPFGGSAAVLLNREPSPLETYNDLDGDVVNFFRVLRERQEELIEALSFTPFSYAEHRRSADDAPDSDTGAVERARLFFIRARQTRSGIAKKRHAGWTWKRHATSRGMAASTSQWMGGIDGLAEVASRFMRVQIDCRPAIDIVRLYDSPSTLFYLDPPYASESRVDKTSYQHEMVDDDHRALASTLKGIQGRAALSGYACPLYDDLFSGWKRTEVPRYSPAASDQRVEILWTNYDHALLETAA